MQNLYNYSLILLFTVLSSIGVVTAQPEMQRPQSQNHNSGVVTGTIVDGAGIPLQ